MCNTDVIQLFICYTICNNDENVFIHNTHALLLCTCNTDITVTLWFKCNTDVIYFIFM